MNRCNLTFRAVLAAALLGAIIWLGLHREVLQTEALEQELARFGACAPILFVVLYALATVLFVPGSVLTLAGGALFGPIWGTLWNLTGATLGSTLAFLIARYVASDWIAARGGERLGRLMRGVDEEGLAFRRVRSAGTAFPLQSHELCLWTDIHPSPRLRPRLLCMHGAGCFGLYLSGLRWTRGGLWTSGSDPLGCGCLGAARGRRFPAEAGSPD
jgi:SNARE associated Golgi protein